MPEKKLVDKTVTLERFEGKGGWTYAHVLTLPPKTAKPLGWQKVNGTIDGYAVTCSLMPMGKGRWFVPVKADIRKVIGKEAGDTVRIILFAAVHELHTPEDFLLCLGDEPQALKNYNALHKEEQARCLDWIFAIQEEETQVQRMAEAIDRLLTGYQWKVAAKQIPA